MITALALSVWPSTATAPSGVSVPNPSTTVNLSPLEQSRQALVQGWTRSRYCRLLTSRPPALRPRQARSRNRPHGVKNTVRMGRLTGPAEEVARVVHLLAADASGYITGQVWGANGGLDM